MSKPRNSMENRLEPPRGSGDGVSESGVAVVEVEAGGDTQVDEAAGNPPKEVRTSGRIAKRHPRADLIQRRKRMRRMKRKGTGTEKTQEWHR